MNWQENRNSYEDNKKASSPFDHKRGRGHLGKPRGMGIGEGCEQRSEATLQRPQWEGERAIKEQTEKEKT